MSVLFDAIFKQLATSIDNLKVSSDVKPYKYQKIETSLKNGKLPASPKDQLLVSQFFFRYRLVDQLAAAVTGSTSEVAQVVKIPGIFNIDHIRLHRLLADLTPWEKQLEALHLPPDNDVPQDAFPTFANPLPQTLSQEQSAFKDAMSYLHRSRVYANNAHLSTVLQNICLFCFMIKWQCLVNIPPSTYDRPIDLFF